MSKYNPILLDHFHNPRNVGELPDADGLGIEGNPGNGPVVKIYLKWNSSIINEISFKTYGCGASIACCSILTEMVKGKTLEEAHSVTANMILSAVGGLPLGKQHCPKMAVTALKKALKRDL